jgi:hypothetical protein
VTAFNLSRTATKPCIWSGRVLTADGYRRVWFYRMPTPWPEDGEWRHVGVADSWVEAMVEVWDKGRVRWYVCGGAKR